MCLTQRSQLYTIATHEIVKYSAIFHVCVRLIGHTLHNRSTSCMCPTHRSPLYTIASRQTVKYLINFNEHREMGENVNIWIWIVPFIYKWFRIAWCYPANSNSDKLALLPLRILGPPWSLVTESQPGPSVSVTSQLQVETYLFSYSLATFCCSLVSSSYSPAVPTPVKG